GGAMRLVRGLRETVGRKIVEERNRAGKFADLADLLRRVPELNKREVRALSIAGALNFDNSVHRREALWRSELELRPKGTLFDRTTETEETDPHFLSRLEGVDLVAADLRKTGISIGRHP